jgi:hypothetical protein
MAIADLDAYKAALGQQREIVSVNIGATTTIAGRTYDLWRTAVPIGAIPTSTAVCDRTTAGAFGQQNPPAGEQLSIIGARFSALNPGNYLICDRLIHMGGLDGTVTDPQVTDNPATSLTRYTSGDGVMIGLTIYTQLGTTVTSVTANYQNQANAASNTEAVVIGGTGFREAHRMILLPLASGDTGVLKVNSVTLAGTTASIGNFGVTLFKPLYAICVDGSSGVLSAAGFITGNTVGGIAKVENDACLFAIAISQGLSGLGSGALVVEEN